MNIRPLSILCITICANVAAFAAQDSTSSPLTPTGSPGWRVALLGGVGLPISDYALTSDHGSMYTEDDVLTQYVAKVPHVKTPMYHMQLLYGISDKVDVGLIGTYNSASDAGGVDGVYEYQYDYSCIGTQALFAYYIARSDAYANPWEAAALVSMGASYVDMETFYTERDPQTQQQIVTAVGDQSQFTLAASVRLQGGYRFAKNFLVVAQTGLLFNSMASNPLNYEYMDAEGNSEMYHVYYALPSSFTATFEAGLVWTL